MSVTTVHHIYVAFDYPPGDHTSPDWEVTVNNAIFDLKREVDHIHYCHIDSGSEPSVVESQTDRLHSAHTFQMQLKLLLDAYGCNVHMENT